MERVNASIIGFNAVKGLMQGHKNQMVGIVNKTIVYTPFEKAVKHKLHLDRELEELIEILGS